MRTIKFRGKSLTTGEWLYGSHFNDGAEDYILPNLPSGTVDYESYQVDQNTVGQFTCLYDKNGKEIYEGDIIKIPTKHGDDVLWIGYETSHIGAFCLCEDDDCNSKFVSIFGRNYDYEPFYCEVIGNIYDNPELINE